MYISSYESNSRTSCLALPRETNLSQFDILSLFMIEITTTNQRQKPSLIKTSKYTFSLSSCRCCTEERRSKVDFFRSNPRPTISTIKMIATKMENCKLSCLDKSIMLVLLCNLCMYKLRFLRYQLTREIDLFTNLFDKLMFV